MADNTRLCLVCSEPKDAHTDAPEVADHAWEPDRDMTPDEAAALVTWVGNTHGGEAARETASDLAREPESTPEHRQAMLTALAPFGYSA